MSLFEFLMVLVSIIIGLGITEVLKGIAQMVRCRQSVTPYWVHSVLVVFVMIALLQQWWEIWDLQRVSDWTFTGLLLMLSGPVGLFLIAHLLFPQPVRDADIREYYYGEMRPVWWLGAATVVLATLFRPIVTGFELFVINNATSFIGLAGFIVLGLTKNRIVHAILVPLFLATILWDVLALSFEIGQ